MTKYQVKKEYVGKVKLVDGTGETVLDAKVPQAKLAEWFALGIGFIDAVETAQPTKNDAKTGQ